jgi:D-erythronate 2-dehydrogenase
LIRRTPDAAIQKIVAGWPRDFSAERAEAAGFVADPDFAAIVRAHIADERARAAQMNGDAA